MSVVLLSFKGLEAVDTEQLVLLVGEADKADGCLGRAAAPPRVGDGVAYAAVSQPARVTSVEAQELPRGEHLPHLGDLGAIVLACLDSLIIRELCHVEAIVQVVESP